jgi:hypothetical protein
MSFALASLAQATVALVTCLPFAAPSAQKIPIPEDATITLERTACFGDCPVYTVSIDARGNVVYNGTEFVRVKGRHTSRIAVARVAEILEQADRIGFFDLNDQYVEIRHPDGSISTVTDLPTTIVTIARGGRTKRVEDYVGAPEGLAALERLIDEVANTKQWVALDAQALGPMVKDGWRPEAKVAA